MSTTAVLGLNKDLSSDYYDVAKVNANTDKLDAAFAEVKSCLNFYRLDMDSNGIYTTLEWRRADGTKYKKSLLSGGTSPKYTVRTITYYDTDGTTVLVTKVYSETYTGDELTSEVLA